MTVRLSISGDYLEQGDVDSPERLAEYVQQVVGTPYPNNKDMNLFKKKLKEFFAATPAADMRTLCRVADFCRAHKKRPAMAIGIFSQVKWAWSAGHLPELDPGAVPRELDGAIEAAIAEEQDADWRRRLMLAAGVTGKKKAYEAWLRHRKAA